MPTESPAHLRPQGTRQEIDENLPQGGREVRKCGVTIATGLFKKAGRSKTPLTRPPRFPGPEPGLAQTPPAWDGPALPAAGDSFPRRDRGPFHSKCPAPSCPWGRRSPARPWGGGQQGGRVRAGFGACCGGCCWRRRPGNPPQTALLGTHPASSNLDLRPPATGSGKGQSPGLHHGRGSLGMSASSWNSGERSASGASFLTMQTQPGQGSRASPTLSTGPGV